MSTLLLIQPLHTILTTIHSTSVTPSLPPSHPSITTNTNRHERRRHPQHTLDTTKILGPLRAALSRHHHIRLHRGVPARVASVPAPPHISPPVSLEPRESLLRYRVAELRKQHADRPQPVVGARGNSHMGGCEITFVFVFFWGILESYYIMPLRQSLCFLFPLFISFVYTKKKSQAQAGGFHC